MWGWWAGLNSQCGRRMLGPVFLDVSDTFASDNLQVQNSVIASFHYAERLLNADSIEKLIASLLSKILLNITIR